MPFTRAGQLARPVPTARLTDPLGLVAENLRNAPHGVLPVLDRPTFGEGDPSERMARVIGLIDIRALSLVSAKVIAPVHTNGGPPNGGHPHSEYTNGTGLFSNGAPSEEPLREIDATTFENLTARDVMSSDVPFIPAAFSLHNALLTLDRYDMPSLPVIDEHSSYRGIISRADILAALGNNVRPAMVGGMATPLGVWLTDGVLTGGAPALGLVLTGLTLALCHAFSRVALILLMYSINRNWGAIALSGRIGLEIDGSGLLNTGAFFAQGFLFLVALRAIPLAGIHAAEHQTVWALERGLPLEVEYVEKMPRAHPRCGTNLLALLGLVTIGFAHIPDFSPEWVMLVLIITFFAWRNFGTLLQQYFTTRPASRKQLESGIKAAKELVAKYQAEPFAVPRTPFRLLNSGLIWAAVGMMTGTLAFEYLLEFVSLRIIQ